MRKDKRRVVGPISATEKQAALKVWIQNCQTLHYNNEIANLTSSSSSTRLPLVRQLRLFLDPDGFIRCGGRIHNAPLSELARFPYLLPKNCTFTELIDQETLVVNNSTEQERTVRNRPIRTSATRAANIISEWTKILRRPRRMSKRYEHSSIYSSGL